MSASHRWPVRPTDPEPSLDPPVGWGDWHHWAFDELFAAREPSSREHHVERKYSASAKGEAPAALAAEGEARVRAGASVTVMLMIGFALTGGSIMLWPQGLFNLVLRGPQGRSYSSPSVQRLAGGVTAIRMATCRHARLKTNLVEVGKAHSAFVNAPKFQLPAIGSVRNWGFWTPNQNFQEPTSPKR